MQKKITKTIVYFSIMMLLTLSLGLVVLFHDRQKPILADPSIDNYATTLTHNESFTAKTTQKTIAGLSNGQFSYNDRNYQENQSGSDFVAGDTIMLHNYKKTIGNTAENIYLSFGKKYTESDIQNDAHPILTDIQTVTIYVNGVYQNNVTPITPNTKEDNTALKVGDYTSNYWYAYFDLNSDTFGNYGQGSYSIGFTYNMYYYDETTKNYQASENLTYRFDFTIVDQNTYAMGYVNHHNFPDVLNGSRYVENQDTFYQKSILAYYYNYSIDEAPVLEYDVENYNITYTHTTNTSSNTYTTWTSRDEQNRVVLHTLRDGSQVSEVIIPQTDGHHLHHIAFDTQGTYDITIYYQMQISATDYLILDSVPVSNYQFDETYPSNLVSSDKIQINVFGAKAYYNQNGVATPFYYAGASTTLDADYTARVYTKKGQTTYHQISTYNVNNDTAFQESYHLIKDYFPVTNQGPVSFSYYGTMSYDNNISESYYYKYNSFAALQNHENGQKVILPKETAIADIGYYEVTLVYTSNNAHNTSTKFYQKFVFAIISGEPEVDIVLEDNSSIQKQYTNQDVRVITRPTSVFKTLQEENETINWVETPTDKQINKLNQDVFCLPFSTYFRVKGFSQSNFGDTQMLNNTTTLSENGHYQVIVRYGVSSQKTYEFTIDKSAPNNPTATLVQPIRASKDNPTIIGYMKNNDRELDHITNDWFALEYDFYKESGAKVNVTYVKYTFSYDEEALNTNSTYVANGYVLLGNQSVESNSYKLDLTSNGTYSLSSVLKPTSTSLYVFTLLDEAGNKNTFAILFDNSAPRLMVDPTPTNTYNMVNVDTNVTWGTHKTLAFKDTSNELTSAITSLELPIVENTIAIPLTSVEVTYAQGDREESKSYDPNGVHQLQLKTSEDQTNIDSGIFGGENVYTIVVKDGSMVSTQNTTSPYTIEMNLDQSASMVWTGSNSQPLNRVTNLYTGNVTNANGLYFSYIPGDSSTQFYLEEGDVTYDYYPFDPTAYATSGSKETLTNMLALIDEINQKLESESLSSEELERIRPYYPFVSFAGRTNVVVKRSSSPITLPNAEEGRVVSTCINPSSIDGNTQEGMYVFRREYKHNFDAGTTTDSKVRYYVMIVDRSRIFDIDANTVDQTTNTYDLNFYFNNGGGISFDIGAGLSQYHMDALTIQNYIQSPVAGSIMFRTNKLPVTLTFPTEKYNAYLAFQQWIDTLDGKEDSLSVTEKQYLNEWFTKTKFTFDINENTLTLTKSTNVGVVTTSLPLSRTNDDFAYTASCLEEGQYTLTLTDRAGNQQVITFEIVYDSPIAALKGKNDAILPSINTYNYKATNSEELYFEFETYLDPLQANIDITDIIVEQIVEGTTNTYILEYLSTQDAINVYQNNKQTLPIITENRDIVRKESVSGGTKYKLTLLPDSYDGTILPFDPTVEATYHITIQYENFALLNLDSDLYRRTFSITIDRTAPSLNRNALIAKDKFYGEQAIVNDLSILDKYFLAVSKTDTLTYYGGLENSDLYYRTIKTTNHFDQDTSYPSTYLPTKFFSPSAKDEFGNDLFTRVQNFLPNNTLDNTYSMEDIFDSYGYYELIEVDEAGNYTIYPVYYFDPNTTLHFTYKDADSDTQDGVLHATISRDGLSLIEEQLTEPSDNMVLAKKELQLDVDGIMSDDQWLKVIITYADGQDTLLLDPTGENGYLTSQEFIAAFNQKLTELENTKQNIHSFNITFVNRNMQDYTLTYLTPTSELRLIFNNLSSSEFSVEIPRDTATGGQTIIEKFSVYRFTENGYVNILRDNVDNPITPAAGRIYYFRDGQYKFEYTDNFKRSHTEYHSIGADYFHSILYVNSVTGASVPSKTLSVTENINGINEINQITYLAHTALIEFDTKVYQYVIRVYDEANHTYVDYTRLDAYRNNLFSVQISDSSTNTSHKLIEIFLTQNDTISSLRFLVILKFIDRDQVDEENPEGEYYRFEITHELPKLSLLNFSGVTIQNVSTTPEEPTQFSEDIYVTWEESEFGEEIILTKDNQETIVINEQNYCIKEEGYYKLSIKNGLDYHSDTTGETLYFRRTSSDIVMYEVMAVSNDSMSESILTASPKRTTYVDHGLSYPVYEYYKLDNTTTDIRLNKNKNLSVEIVEETPNDCLYRIFGNSDYGYIRYIRVHSIHSSTTLVSDVNDENRNSLVITDNNLVTSTGAPLILHYENKIQCTSKDGLTLTWNYYHYNDDDPQDKGNIIQTTYYYNNEYVDTIYETSKQNSLTLNAAGYYQFIFRDLAGNIQQFVINGTTYHYLFLYIVNDVLFTVNGQEPINHQIFNSDVTIRLTNRDLYDPGVVISAKKDGKTYNVSSTGTSGNYVYTFTDHGSYEVTLTSYVRDINGANTEIKTITTTYMFTIINANQILLGYHISPAYHFTLTNLIKDNVNITNLVEDKSSLWLSNMSYGNGKYTVSLSYYHETLKKEMPFSFSIWINSEIPTLVASIDWGTSTSKPITVSFNMSVIYQQIGDSYISINGLDPIWINSQTASSNTRTDIVINSIGDNWVSLYTADGQLVNSYKVTRTEPLNTLSIVLIVIGSIVAVALVVLFIVLRRRIKVR